ncbi:Solute carrier family 13 member 4 [Armadillidium nasatum]|uniref:Solute carrier family 13 member 4 n=1 Tax=Armadillidium nasatum TaxID=96803 RepID=A0A5N5SZL4_9CRUS|nr:Solute carrier family 13 member 4 [Armadillidium nasatum]
MGWTIKIVHCYWRLLTLLLTPVLLLPIPVIYGDSKETRCVYILLMMVIFWVTEALPSHITSLLPLFAFPLLGIMPSKTVCLHFFVDAVVLLVGSLWLSVAMDSSGLNKRIALYILTKIGCGQRLLMATFMAVTTLLSIWVNDTSATAFVIPTLDALLEEMDTVYQRWKPKGRFVIPKITITDIEGNKKTCIGGEINEGFVEDDLDLIHVVRQPELTSNSNYTYNEEEIKKKKKDVFTVSNLRRSFYLSVAYSATIAGTGLINGSSTNYVVIRLLNKNYSDPTEVNFVTWMAFNLPLTLICLCVTWIWLQFLYFGLRRDKSFDSKECEKKEIINKYLKNRYKSLGEVSFHEGVTLILVLLLIILWVFRKPGYGYGWGNLLETLYGPDSEVSDACAVMLVVFVMFVIPANLPEMFSSSSTNPVPAYGCLTWSTIQSTISWGVVFLVGGRYSVALSNCINPLYFLLPISICCSYGFILPVATSPNAIIYYSSSLKLYDMIKAGAGLSIFCIIVINIMINTLGVTVFNLNEIPSWINSTTGIPPTC